MNKKSILLSGMGRIQALKRMSFRPSWWCLAVVAMAMSVTACSEEETAGQGGDGDLKVEVRLTYSLGEELGDIASAVIAYPATSNIEEGVVLDTLDSGGTWTRTLTYDSPATVGMLVTALHWPDVVPEATITANFSYSCEVRLLSGDGIVDVKSSSAMEELTFSYENDSLLTEQLATVLEVQRWYSVDESGITEVDIVIDDSDLEDAVDIPEEDEDAVTMRNPLYYISSVDLEPNHEYLHDNLLARFPVRSPYAAGQVLSKGDFLLLRGAEISSFDQETLKASAANGAMFILEDVPSYQTLANFCDIIGAHNPLPETAEVDTDMFIIADGDVNLSNNDDTPYMGFFYVLSPTDSVGNHVRSDYVQGQIVDDALLSLERLFSGTSTSASTLTRAGMVADGGSDLTMLISAYKVYFSVTISVPWEWYTNTSKAGVGTTSPINSFSMEYDIWNAYSIAEKRNYYYIHQEFMGAFKNGYKGIYNVGTTKVCEWYGREVDLATTSSTSGMQIHRHSPITTESSTTYTSGFSWNLSGEVGYESGGGVAKLSGGVSVDNSTTYTINDVTVSDYSNPGNEQLGWLFEIARPRANFKLTCTGMTNLHAGALLGRTTFTCGTDFIISFPDTGEAPKLTSTNRIRHEKVEAKWGDISYRAWFDNASLSKTFELPYLTSSDF